MNIYSRATIFSIALTSALLAGCGGDSSDSSSPAPVPAQTSSLQGTAATGNALSQGLVAIVDSTGKSPCAETSIVTAATGSYTCTLVPGEVAPFFVSVTDPSGIVRPLVSVATTTPTPGTPQVVNATTLTTAILAQLASDHNALTIFNSKTVDASALANLKANVLAQLQPVLAAIGMPAGYDPFTTSITAANTAGAGNTADLVLDIVKVGVNASGAIFLSTLDNPTGVVMASATAAGTPLPATTASASALSTAMQALAQSFQQCYALPAAQRALTVDTTVAAANGGATVTSMDAKCQSLTDPGFLQNGYSAGQLYYSILTSDGMTGAKFSVPGVLFYSPASSSANGLETAIVNILYIDGSGQPGSSIVVATNKAATGAAPNWVLTGNQQPVDVSLRSTLRLLQQQAPVAQFPFSSTALPSTYQTGLEMFVRKDGPGSAGLTAARVSGPGLPAAGIVLTRPPAAYEVQQPWLNIADKAGGDPAVLATRPNTCNCDIFWLERTQGISGTSATTVLANPGANTSNTTNNVNWAHPLDYGAAIGTPTDQYVPLANFAAGATYKIELFYNGSSSATYSYQKTLLTPVVVATQGASQAWNAPTAATLNLLDPGIAASAAATASFALSWTQNPSAEQIQGAQAFSGANGIQVNQGTSTAVPRGATSATVSAPAGLSFTALDTTGNSYRWLQLTYRTFDGSEKIAQYRYN